MPVMENIGGAAKSQSYFPLIFSGYKLSLFKEVNEM